MQMIPIPPIRELRIAFFPGGFEVEPEGLELLQAELGSVRFKWSGTIDDEEEAFARAVVAASGPLITDAWDLDRSRQDREKVEELISP
ncbi:MAG TPA: hypothetical protein VF195_12200 [Actinomycetota bacterium]